MTRLFTVMLLVLTIPLFAQNLEDLELYKQMKASQALYQEAYEEGDYDAAMTYAEEVKQYAEELKTYLDNLEEEPAAPEPEPEPEPVPEPEPEPEPMAAKNYEVKRGDTLWDIAAKSEIYGNPWEWPSIYTANKSVLNDPDNPSLIHSGMIFEIPVLKE